METVGNNYKVSNDNLALNGRVANLTASLTNGNGAFSDLISSMLNAQKSDESCSFNQKSRTQTIKSDSKDLASGASFDKKSSDSSIKEDDAHDISKEDCADENNSFCSGYSEISEGAFEKSDTKNSDLLTSLSVTEDAPCANSDNKSAAAMFSSLQNSVQATAQESVLQDSESVRDFESAFCSAFTEDLSGFDNISEETLKASFDLSDESFKNIASDVQKIMNNPVKDVSSQSLVSSMMKEVNVTSVSMNDYTTVDVNELDFAVDEFSNIESSIKASIMLDEQSNQIAKEKIDAIMDSKAQNNSDALNESLALLRGTASNKSAVLENIELNSSGRMPSSDTMVFTGGINSAAANEDAEVFDESGESLLKTVSSAKASSALSQSAGTMNQGSMDFGSDGEQGRNSRGDLNSSLMHRSNKIFRQESTQKFDLLRMSQNLRTNAEEIAQKVMQMASRNMKSMQLNLNPEGLGKMKISLDMTGNDNLAKVTLSASLDSTKEMIEKSLGLLKDALRDNDIEADAEVVDYLEKDSENEQSFEGQGRENKDSENTDENAMFAYEGDDLSEDLTDEADNDVMDFQNRILNSQKYNRFSRLA